MKRTQQLVLEDNPIEFLILRIHSQSMEPILLLYTYGYWLAHSGYQPSSFLLAGAAIELFCEVYLPITIYKQERAMRKKMREDSRKVG